MAEPPEGAEAKEVGSQEGFGELLKYTAAGYLGGLLLGLLLDTLGFQRSAIGQWLVRTVSGEGESIFEGLYAIRQRLKGTRGSMAEAYGWGKFLGLIFPWIVDWGSRTAGMGAYGWESFYIPYFYAMSDQIGGSAAGFLFLRRREGNWYIAAARYIRHPVMLTSLAVILIVPLGLLVARLIGFSPTTQVYTALETIAANLCWAPPLVGWLHERKQ